jgi:3,4-dihydroxy-2-butanone 4-phosphate synthase
LEFIPQILEKSFVIVMDDAEREGEIATIAEIESALKRNGIKFCKGIYPGMTTCCVIASADSEFLCSM